MKKGEVRRVSLPFASGHAQAGDRPAIILQDLPFNNSLPTTLIVPLTSKQSSLRFAGTLLVQPDPQNGLTTPSVALVFQLRALDQRHCGKVIGVIDAATLSQIDKLLDQLTGR